MNEIHRIRVMVNNVEYYIVILQSENSYTVRGILNNNIITPSYSVTREMREDIVYGDYSMMV